MLEAKTCFPYVLTYTVSEAREDEQRRNQNRAYRDDGSQAGLLAHLNQFATADGKRTDRATAS